MSRFEKIAFAKFLKMFNIEDNLNQCSDIQLDQLLKSILFQIKGHKYINALLRKIYAHFSELNLSQINSILHKREITYPFMNSLSFQNLSMKYFPVLIFFIRFSSFVKLL